jgi:hypothetical protein
MGQTIHQLVQDFATIHSYQRGYNPKLGYITHLSSSQPWMGSLIMLNPLVVVSIT